MYSCNPLVYISDDDFSEVGHPIRTLEALDKLLSVDLHLFTDASFANQDEVFRRYGAKIDKCILNGEILKDIFLSKVAAFSDRKPHFVLKMPRMTLLHSFLIHLSSNFEIFKNGFLISILFSETPEGFEKFELELFDSVYRLILSHKPLSHNTIVFCERRVLLDTYSTKYPDLRYELCGFPTVVEPNNNIFNRVGYAFIGESRLDKGFSQIIDLSSLAEFTLDLYVHTNCNPRNSSVLHDLLIKKLEDIAISKPNVHTIKQDIDEPYDALFCEGITPLLLYDKKYKFKGSGILQEIHYNGMFAIAYSDLEFHLDFPGNVINIDRTSNVEKLYCQILNASKDISNKKQTAASRRILTPEKFYEIISKR